jgi:GntR family transcriptional regulator
VVRNASIKADDRRSAFNGRSSRNPNWPLALLAFMQNAQGVNAVERIGEGLTTLIATGMLSPGDRVPSARELSGILRVHPNTVHKVFKRLTAFGMLRTVSTVGTYVARREMSGNSFGAVHRFDEAFFHITCEAKIHGITLAQLRAALSRCWREYDED